MAGTDADGQDGRQLGVLLLCFDRLKAAAAARRPLDEELRSRGAAVLDTAVMKVNAKHRASVYDPRRVLQGTLTAALTWGVFGLLSGGLASLGVWAIIGAVCGGSYAYLNEHILTKSELARLGDRLPASTSALLTFAVTSDPGGMLQAAAARAPAVASVAAIDDNLGSHVVAPAAGPHQDSRAALLNMIVLRYPDPGTAKQIASRAAPKSKKETGPVQVELVIWADRDGRRHVADPTHGAKAYGTSDMISWGVFGLVFGALAGATGGGGVHSFVASAVVTGIGWALFGLAAGALYGLWAGRAISARRFTGLRGLLVPGSSILGAWADGPVPPEAITPLRAPGAQLLILGFSPVEGGAVLEAA